MLEMKLTIEAPELANALNNLAAALGARPFPTAQQAPAAPVQQPQPVVPQQAPPPPHLRNSPCRLPLLWPLCLLLLPLHSLIRPWLAYLSHSRPSTR